MTRTREPFFETMLLVTLTLSACARSGGDVTHQSLLSNDPIRSAFNADSGKVRAIFLASPT